MAAADLFRCPLGAHVIKPQIDACNAAANGEMEFELSNSVTGAWFGSYFANTASWAKVPPHLQELFKITIDQSHYYRNVWYWGGEAKLRVEGEKMELTSLPDEEWAQVLADSNGFLDEVAASSPRSGRVIEAFKKYADTMTEAGYPNR